MSEEDEAELEVGGPGYYSLWICSVMKLVYRVCSSWMPGRGRGCVLTCLLGPREARLGQEVTGGKLGWFGEQNAEVRARKFGEYG